MAGDRVRAEEVRDVEALDERRDGGQADEALELADAVERRNTVTLSVTEGQLYLDVNGVSLTSGIHRRSIV